MFSSHNSTYNIQISGLQYEGLVGMQEIALITSFGDTLWKTHLHSNALIFPAVSDIGDVAITKRQIKIYDKNKKLKGEYNFSREESPYTKYEGLDCVHGFVPSGKAYIMLMKTSPINQDVYMYCLSDSARIEWKLNLGRYFPCDIKFYKDKIITSDFCNATRNYTNRCYIINLDGKILWQYEKDIRGRSDLDLKFDKKKGILIFQEKSKQIQIDLNNLNVDNN